MVTHYQHDPTRRQYANSDCDACLHYKLSGDSDREWLHGHSKRHSDGQCIADTNGQQPYDLRRTISNIDRYRRGNISMEHYPDHQSYHGDPCDYNYLFCDSYNKWL